MKRVLKYLAILVLIVIVAIAGAALYINISGIPSYETDIPEYTAAADSATLARGEKLVGTLCAGCHMNKESGKLSGGPLFDAPPEFGKLYTPNITQDKTHGIGDWTDGEILYLLRTGIKRDGQYAPPYMAKLPHMSDYDINAIIAFLRSDDPMVEASPVPNQESKPSFLTKFLCRIAFKPFPMPDGPISEPDTSNTVEWGKYLIFNLDCYQCHSSSFETNNSLEPEKSKGYLAGGNMMLTMDGKEIIAPNITPDKKTGIGSWTDEQFLNAVKFGSMDNESPLQYPMQAYNKLSDQEIMAIHSYLKTITPVENETNRLVYN